VDMGGTTTDTAALAGGAVSVCDRGSNVGGHMTHVKALEIRTRGLGGDSLIQMEKGETVIGPRRVAPMAWLGAHHPGTDPAVTYLESRIHRYASSTRGMQVLALNGAAGDMDLTGPEREIIALLTARPCSIDELLERTGAMIERALPIRRLEEYAVIQRCGLTPTDLLHITGRFDRWDGRTAARYAAIYAAQARTDVLEMAQAMLEKVVRELALELLKRELDGETDPDAIHTCPVCRTLVENLFAGGSDHYRVRIDLKHPIVGIGAPIHYFLPRAAELLGAKAVLPPDADVANAIGAITSDVVVKRHVRIIPDQAGGFLIEGIPGTRQFRQFEAADEYARDRLVAMVRDQAAVSGTSTRRVELVTEDQVPRAAGGAEIFIGRVISATLVGRPDRVLQGD
ncbi:hydantoinase/oxoprolinase family protein, partial [Desulfococcus sp.]|uniref:hydantoinase/oxoprolinase family protein n=1 Tax=Desulfococcus sp. TaxID=2025834 RepID=UPI003593C40F